jgi:uncharacterized membrane protein
MTIQSPLAWGWDRLRSGAHTIGTARQEEYWPQTARAAPAIRRIGPADLRAALLAGLDDFRANRTDVIFLCVFYPVIGLLLARVSLSEMLPLAFPLAAGFALVGPVGGIGLNEMSRRRELGENVTWADTFKVLRAPSIGAIALLGILLMALFLLWLLAAAAIYELTLGPAPPPSIEAFLTATLTTGPGWAMIGIGVAVGFCFAALVLAVSLVSFPLLLDRDGGIDNAVRTSLRAARANVGTVALWGLIVAALLVLGSIPLFIGLTVVMPVLGHASWHLYRRIVQ